MALVEMFALFAIGGLIAYAIGFATCAICMMKRGRDGRETQKPEKRTYWNWWA